VNASLRLQLTPLRTAAAALLFAGGWLLAAPVNLIDAFALGFAVLLLSAKIKGVPDDES